jgi:NAD-dependent dihydropyrimidine dehydrogenase PreA subunit
MKPREVPGYLRDIVFRLLPHRAPTGLVRIGSPGPSSPVLVTGNYTLTVRRMRQALAGLDAWLLVANSNGINVWCAAGGGHLTHHDVISVLRTSGIGDLVEDRLLILPQLAATGVERRPIEAATGWRTRWGPARLEDLREFLEGTGRVPPRLRFIRFPLWERLEMAAIWIIPMVLIAGLLVGAIGGWRAAVCAAAAATLTVAAIFAALPRLTVTGPRRWITYGGFALLGAVVGGLGLTVMGAAGPRELQLMALTSVVAMAVLSVDLSGTTPWYPGSINTAGGGMAIELASERCTAAADCVRVCPVEVLRMNGREQKVEIANPVACIQCGACVVQCPEDALYFRTGDGRVLEPVTIRRTRMNLVGRRTVEVRDDPAGPPPPSPT